MSITNLRYIVTLTNTSDTILAAEPFASKPRAFERGEELRRNTPSTFVTVHDRRAKVGAPCRWEYTALHGRNGSQWVVMEWRKP